MSIISVWWSLEESSTSMDPRCLWWLVLNLFRKWQPLQMRFSSSRLSHKAGPRCAKSCANSDPTDGVWQYHQYHLLFLGTRLLGLQTSAMEGSHLLPLNPQARLSFCGFLDLFVSLEGFHSCSPLSPQLFTHRELDVYHSSIPNIAQTEQRPKKHFPFVHFKHWCSYHGCKSLVNWTYWAKHLTLKKMN